jgi:hypothetical protein
MPKWDFAGVRAALLNAGIAPKYVRRALREIQEHLADLCAGAEEHGLTGAEAIAYAEARIGTCEALVSAYLEQPNLKSWGARWPKRLFILAPLLCLLASMMILTVGAYAVLEAFVGVNARQHHALPALLRYCVTALPMVGMHGLPSIMYLAVSVYAIRRRLKPLWPAVGIVVIALLESMTVFTVSLPHDGQQGAVGFGVSAFPWGIEGVLVRLLIAVPFAIAPYLVWRHRRLSVRVNTK